MRQIQASVLFTYERHMPALQWRGHAGVGGPLSSVSTALTKPAILYPPVCRQADKWAPTNLGKIWESICYLYL